jgi:DNA polymerase-3 subunit delta'
VALNLLNDPGAMAFREERLADLRTLLSDSRRVKFAAAEKLARDREGLRRTLLVWSAYWRDVLLLRAGSEAPLTNVDRAAELRSLAGRLSLPEARRAVSEIELGIERLERNVNPRLLVEVLLMDMPKL